MSLRNKFKATDVSSLKKNKQEEDSKISSGRGRTDYLDIDDGLNKFRIFPKHPEEELFYHIRGVHWCTIEGEDGKDGRRTIPNARIHANWPTDPFEAYIQLVKENLDSKDADDADKLKKLTGWETGLNLQTTWVCYANKMVKNKPNEFGLLEFKKTVRDALNDESIIEDEDEAIVIDPFTDPDDGKPVLITYNSKAKKAADYYKVQMSKTAVRLSDEELEKFEKVTPLSQLPQFQYTPEVFEQALEGIQHFDSEFEIDLFDTDEFQNLIEDMRENFNSVKSTKSTAVKSTKKQQIVEDDDEEEEDGDKFDAMDRKELKTFISDNGLDIKVFKTTSDDEIRNSIRELYEEEEEELEEEEDETEVDEEDETEVDEVEKEEEEDEEEEEETDKKVVTKKDGKKPKTLEEIKAELRKRQGK